MRFNCPPPLSGILSTARATTTGALLTAFMAGSSLVAQAQTQAFYPLLTDLFEATNSYGPVILTGNLGPPPAMPSNGVCSNGIRIYNTGGQNIATPIIASLDLTDFEIDIDFNMAALPAGQRAVITGGNSYRYIGIALQTNGTVGVKYNNNNYTWSSTLLVPGTWYSASLKYERGIVALYINGAMVHMATVGTLNHVNDKNFMTVDYTTGNAFDGCIRNLRLTNDTTIPAARWSTYGSGCVFGGAPGFYEQFSASGFDLSGTGVTMLSTPPSYALVPNSQPIVQPTSAARTIANNQTIQVPLPWAFPYQRGTATNSLWVCSNGWVALEATTSTDSTETVAELLSGPARVFGLWDDLDPSVATGGGTVHWEQDPANASLFHVTFLGVPTYGTTNTNDFQYTFHQSGTVEIKWGNCSVTGCMVGFAPGSGQNDPGPTDVSAVTVQVLGDGVRGLALDNLADDRPILGTTFDMEVSEIPASAAIGVMIYSWTTQNPGISLTGVGMDGCFLYLSLGAQVIFVPTGTAINTQIAVPNLPQLVGRHIYAQAAVLGSTATALGVLSSNGGDMLFDLN